MEAAARCGCGAIGGGATAAAALPAGAAGTVSQPAQLAVAAGDLLGFDLLDGAQLSREPDPLHIGGYAIATWTPALADGETRAPAERFEGWLYAQATVEPDADGDGLGDDTQDPDHGQPAGASRGGGGNPPGGGGGTPPGGGGGNAARRRRERPALPAVPKGGPAPKLPARAVATARGVVVVQLANPYAADARRNGHAEAGPRPRRRHADVDRSPARAAPCGCRSAPPRAALLAQRKRVRLHARGGAEGEGRQGPHDETDADGHARGRRGQKSAGKRRRRLRRHLQSLRRADDGRRGWRSSPPSTAT